MTNASWIIATELHIKRELNIEKIDLVIFGGTGVQREDFAFESTKTSIVINDNQRLSIEHGILGKKSILYIPKRMHLYEGYAATQIKDLMNVFKNLGAQQIILTNASGSLTTHKEGDIVIINDHINLMGHSPLISSTDQTGKYFVDMLNAYDKEEIRKFSIVMTRYGITPCQGVYAGVLGPQLETPAEYKMLSLLGADLVGMSTVPETISARYHGLKVLALSIVTDLCHYKSLKPINIEKIVEVAKQSSPIIAKLITYYLNESN